RERPVGREIMTHIRIDDVPTEETLRELIAFERGPAVSLLLPTKPRPLEGVPEATTRLKSLLQEAKAVLEQADSPDEKAIDAQLAPARALLDVRGPWVGAAGGLLLYLGDGFARGVRLPEPVAAEARIGERFHVLPLALALADR